MAALTHAHVFFYGMENVVDLWADNVESLGLEGIRFLLHYRQEKNRPAEVLQLRVPLIGRHSVQTVLRAAAVGLVDGLTWQEIVSGLRSASNELRLIAVRTQNGALILDDTYNASPESMLAALNLLNDLEGRKVAVLGDMLELGQYEQRGHEMVGIRAAEVVDELVTLGERGRIIAEAALEAGLSGGKITVLDEVDQAIQYLHPNLKPEDVVLVKGSNLMRMDRIVSALEYHVMRESSYALALAGFAFMLTVIWGEPLLRVLRHLKIGESIRVDGPQRHMSKLGTPTLGGVLFILPVSAHHRVVQCSFHARIDHAGSINLPAHGNVNRIWFIRFGG